MKLVMLSWQIELELLPGGLVSMRAAWACLSVQPGLMPQGIAAMQALPKLAGAQGAAGPLAAAVPGARIHGLRLGAVGHAAGRSSSH